MMFVEASAKTGSNIKEAFEELVDRIYEEVGSQFSKQLQATQLQKANLYNKQT